jgi:pseudouridine synthase
MCGVTSRRGADKLIEQGKVTINNQTVEKPGAVVDDQIDTVRVDGTEVRPVETKLYVLLNKPRMVMTTLHDPFRRRTVRHFIKDVPERVYPVGRLDYDTEGVLLLTNDGELAFRLAHPKYRIPKLYLARVKGRFNQNAASKMKSGLKLPDGAVGHAEVVHIQQDGYESNVKLVLREGRKREVKELFKALGYRVLRLKRLEFAGLSPGRLKRGQWRYLTPDETRQLKKAVDLA